MKSPPYFASVSNFGCRQVVARRGRRHERHELDSPPRLQILQPFEHAGVGHARESVRAPLARERHPVRLLVLAEQDPAQVEAPRRLADRGLEAQLAERDLDLDVPALVVDRRLVVPDRVPVVVDGAAVLDGVGVLVGAERVGAEVEGVAVIVKGIDGDLQLIALVEPGVALHLAAHDAGRARCPRPTRRCRASCRRRGCGTRSSRSTGAP